MHTRLIIPLLTSAFLGFAVAGDLSSQPSIANQSLVLPRQATGVSPCVTNCFTEIFPKFDCLDLTECICYNDALREALSNCVLQSGCDVADAFASQASQAELCKYPVRNKSTTIVVVATVLFSIAIGAATLRALARGTWTGGAGYGADDWILFLCCLPMIGLTTSVYMEAMNGLGQDVYRLTIPEVQHVLMWYYIGNTFYSPVVFGTKASFCLLYLRVWRDGGKVFRYTCWTAIAILGMAFISFEFSTIFICDPPSHIWKVLTRAATLNCIDRNPQLYTNSAVNIFMDFVVLLLPVPNILKLKMSTSKKVGLLATFLIGFAVTAVSATQLYYLVKNVSKIQNPSWDYFPIGLWRVTEIYLSVICCCMPMMPGLLNRMFTRASNSVGIPSIVNQIWEKTTNSVSVGSDTLVEWSQRRSDGQSQGKWRTVRRRGESARISGPYDSATGLEMADRDVMSTEARSSPDIGWSPDPRATPDDRWSPSPFPRAPSSKYAPRDAYTSPSIELHD